MRVNSVISAKNTIPNMDFNIYNVLLGTIISIVVLVSSMAVFKISFNCR